jgi:hypothetical protein
MSSVISRHSRITNRLVVSAKCIVSGNPDPAVKKGDGAYADWVIVAIHGLREYLDCSYRQPLNVLHEMHSIVERLDLDLSELPDFTTVCVRKQQLKMVVWRALVLLSADFHDLGEVQVLMQRSSIVTRPDVIEIT